MVLEARILSWDWVISDCSSTIISSYLSFLIETSVLTGSKLVRWIGVTTPSFPSPSRCLCSITCISCKSYQDIAPVIFLHQFIPCHLGHYRCCDWRELASPLIMEVCELTQFHGILKRCSGCGLSWEIASFMASLVVDIDLVDDLIIHDTNPDW